MEAFRAFGLVQLWPAGKEVSGSWVEAFRVYGFSGSGFRILVEGFGVWGHGLRSFGLRM